MTTALADRLRKLVPLFEENEKNAKPEMVGFVLGYWRKYQPEQLLLVLEEAAKEPEESTKRMVAKLCCFWLEHGGNDFVDDKVLRGRMFDLLRGLVSEALVMILGSMVDHDRKRMQMLADFPKEQVFCDDRHAVQRSSEALAELASPQELADAFIALDRELLSCMNAANVGSAVFSVHFNRIAFAVVSQILCASSKDQQLVRASKDETNSSSCLKNFLFSF